MMTSMNIHEREICKSSPDDDNDDMMKKIHNRQICKSSDYDNDDNDDEHEYSWKRNLQIISWWRHDEEYS